MWPKLKHFTLRLRAVKRRNILRDQKRNAIPRSEHIARPSVETTDRKERERESVQNLKKAQLWGAFGAEFLLAAVPHNPSVGSPWVLVLDVILTKS